MSAINYAYTERVSNKPIAHAFFVLQTLMMTELIGTACPAVKSKQRTFSQYRLAGSDMAFARTGATTEKRLVEDQPDEQRRKVAILDKVFECIATDKTTAEKNLPSARDLFDSHL